MLCKGNRDDIGLRQNGVGRIDLGLAVVDDFVHSGLHAPHAEQPHTNTIKNNKAHTTPNPKVRRASVRSRRGKDSCQDRRSHE